jgi:hypothetical protein
MRAENLHETCTINMFVRIEIISGRNFQIRSTLQMARAKKSKRVWVILFVILLGLVGGTIFFLVKADKEKALDEIFAMSSNSERIGFLNSQGWIVKPDPVMEEEVTLPTEFNDTYTDYLRLQEAQGFDLKKYAGEDVVIYVYDILNFPDYPEGIQANMIVSQNRLIGGEIRQDAANGFIVPLLTESFVDPYDASQEAEQGKTAEPGTAITEPAVTTVSAVQPTITVVTTVTIPAEEQVILEDASFNEVFP